MVTIADAIEVARHLLAQAPEKIAQIGLFGSIARTGHGRDVDLVIFVHDPSLTASFRQKLHRAGDFDTESSDAQAHRRWAAKKTLQLEALAADPSTEGQLDLIILPNYLADWGRLEMELYQAFGEFQGVVQDLLIFVPSQEKFSPFDP